MSKTAFLEELHSLTHYRPGFLAWLFYPRALWNTVQTYQDARAGGVNIGRYAYDVCEAFQYNVGFFRKLFIGIFSRFSKSKFFKDFAANQSKRPSGYRPQYRDLSTKIKLCLTLDYGYSGEKADKFTNSAFLYQLSPEEKAQILVELSQLEKTQVKSAKNVIDSILNSRDIILRDINKFKAIIALSEPLKENGLLEQVMKTVSSDKPLYKTVLEAFRPSGIQPAANFRAESNEEDLIIRATLKLHSNQSLIAEPKDKQQIHDAILKICPLKAPAPGRQPLFSSNDSELIAKLFFEDIKTGIKIAGYIDQLTEKDLTDAFDRLNQQRKIDNLHNVYQALKDGVEKNKLEFIKNHAPTLPIDDRQKLQLLKLAEKLGLYTPSLLRYLSQHQNPATDLLFQVLEKLHLLKSTFPYLIPKFSDFIDTRVQQRLKELYHSSIPATKPYPFLFFNLNELLDFTLGHSDEPIVTEIVKLLILDKTNLFRNVLHADIENHGQSALTLLKDTLAQDQALNRCILGGGHSASGYGNYLLKCFLALADGHKSLLQHSKIMLGILDKNQPSFSWQLEPLMAANQFFEKNNIDMPQQEIILTRLQQKTDNRVGSVELFEVIYEHADQLGCGNLFENQAILDLIFNCEEPEYAAGELKSALATSENLAIIKKYLPELLKAGRNLTSMVDAIVTLEALGKQVEDYMPLMLKSPTPPFFLIGDYLSMEKCSDPAQESLLKDKYQSLQSTVERNDFIKAVRLLHEANLLNDPKTTNVFLHTKVLSDLLTSDDIYFQNAQFLVALKTIHLDHDAIFNTIIENGILFNFDGFYEICTKLAHHGLIQPQGNFIQNFLHSKDEATEAMNFILNFAPLFGFYNGYSIARLDLENNTQNLKNLGFLITKLFLVEPFDMNVIRDIHTKVFNGAKNLDEYIGDHWKPSQKLLALIDKLSIHIHHLVSLEKKPGGPGQSSNLLHNFASTAKVIKPVHQTSHTQLPPTFFTPPSGKNASSSNPQSVYQSASHRHIEWMKVLFTRETLEQNYGKTQQKMENRYEQLLQTLSLKNQNHNNCHYNYI